MAEAADALQRSTGPVKRLKQRIEPDDAAWVSHGNQGRQPIHRLAEDIRRQAIELARSKYAGFNDSHLRDQLVQQEKIGISRCTVRRICGRPV